jgi:phenylalanyl-tRNA synthetase beta chain
LPIIDMPVGLLLDRLSASGVHQSLDALVELLPRLGCEVEEVATMAQFGCGGCDRLLDRTEIQGPPLSCPSCGTDFLAEPTRLSRMGTNRVLRLDMLAVRPDLYDPGGMARFLAGYFGTRPGLQSCALGEARLKVRVDPRLFEEQSLRPHIAAAVVRNVHLDHALVKMIMNLQEDLHWALGRDRKLASIGFYDLDRIASADGATIDYLAVDPDAIRFVPLGFPPGSPGLTPRQILERHKTGLAYAHLLSGFSRYPLLRDGRGTVLSMPPIINSEDTRVVLGTTGLFIDVTGLARRTVDRTLAVIVTSLAETMPGVQIERVVIENPDGAEIVTPKLEPVPMMVDVDEALATIGIQGDAALLSSLLGRMGHGVQDDGSGTLQVLVPAWRNDVMHAVDLMEDVAVAYGYENLEPSLVPTFTVGDARPIEEKATIARRVLVGLGFHQVMTLVLSSDMAAFSRWRLPPDPRAVRIANPISTEQTLCRVSVLPGLLETLAINRQHDLPQSIFEVGDCCLVDPETETGAREERMVGVALIGTRLGYADIRAVADAFVLEMGRAGTCVVRPIAHESFVPGRVAGIFAEDGRQVGSLGELHPEVIEAYGLHHPIAVMEISLEALLA